VSFSGEHASAGLSRWAAVGGLLALFLLQAVLVIAPLKRDASPLTWDEAVHMRNAWKYADDLGAGRWSGLLRPVIVPGHPPYPPFAHAVMGAASRFAVRFGVEPEDGAAAGNVLFLMLLAWSVYLLASDWWGEAAGVAAAFLASLSPPLLEASRHLGVDVALTAWVAAAYAFWSLSRRFTLWSWTAALGLAGAGGMLTKWTFGFYVLPIVVAAAWDLFRPSGKGARLKILSALVISAGLAAPWYAVNLFNVAVKTARAAGLGAQEGDPVSGLGAWLYYLGTFKQALGWTGMGAALSGFLWLLLRRPHDGWVLASWLGASYAVWTFLVSNKDPRYMYPALTVLPLAAASLPFRLPVLLVALLAGSALWQVRGLPARPAWPLAEIVSRTAALKKEPGAAPLTLLANHAFLSGTNLPWYAEREGVDDEVLVRSRSSGLGEFTEFVLVKTGDLGPARTVRGHEAARAEALRPDGWFSKAFSKAAAWPLPDGSEALLFQRIPSPTAAPQAAPERILSALVPGAEAEGLSLQGTGTNYELKAAKLRVKGLILRQVDIRLEGLRLVADDQGAPKALELRRAEVRSLRLKESDAALFLGTRVKSLRDGAVRFLPGEEIEASGRVKGLPARARVRIFYDPAGRRVTARVLSLKASGIPALTGREFSFSLEPGRGWPFLVEMAGLKTVPGAAGEGTLEVAP
jgi:hypothetical protein